MRSRRREPAKGQALNYFKKCGAACAIAILIQACASSPKMSADAPLELKPGNWVGWAQFYQHGHRVDRGDAKDNLKKVEESAGDTKTAEALEVGTLITSVGAGILLGTGAAQAVKQSKILALFRGRRRFTWALDWLRAGRGRQVRGSREFVQSPARAE